MLCKLTYWFLCDRYLRNERVEMILWKKRSLSSFENNILEKYLLTCSHLVKLQAVEPVALLEMNISMYFSRITETFFISRFQWPPLWLILRFKDHRLMVFCEYSFYKNLLCSMPTPKNFAKRWTPVSGLKTRWFSGRWPLLDARKSAAKKIKTRNYWINNGSCSTWSHKKI